MLSKDITFRNRNTENKSGLQSDGYISNLANKLIPKMIHVDYDPQRIENFKTNLNILLPNYEIKTHLDDLDVEGIMKHAEERYKRDGE
jgi:hypothetical protein